MAFNGSIGPRIHHIVSRTANHCTCIQSLAWQRRCSTARRQEACLLVARRRNRFYGKWVRIGLG